MESAYFTTTLGTIYIEGDATSVSVLRFIETTIDQPDDPPKLLQPIIDEIQAYFRGETQSSTIQIRAKGTEFQQSVWDFISKIPFGKTYSYSEISKQMGIPKATRAVASAIGKNPVLLLIPCHRVIGNNGTLTGYSGGKWRKQWLLQHENKNQTTINI